MVTSGILLLYSTGILSQFMFQKKMLDLIFNCTSIPLNTAETGLPVALSTMLFQLGTAAPVQNKRKTAY